MEVLGLDVGGVAKDGVELGAQVDGAAEAVELFALGHGGHHGDTEARRRPARGGRVELGSRKYSIDWARGRGGGGRLAAGARDSWILAGFAG